MLFHDALVIDGAARITRDGFFVADARVASANNIQDYRVGTGPGELDIADKPKGSTVRIFRAADQIFTKDSMASAAHRPITINHPLDDVNSANWKRLAVGDVGGEVMRDGDTMRVPIKIMDAGGVQAARTTHQEFSLGYSADLDMTPGTFGDEAYDGSIRNIRYNHLALVPAARGGPALRIVDERPAYLRDQEKQTMKIKIGDAEVDATNGEAVSVAVKALDAKLVTLEAANGELATKLSDANTKVATLETEKATLTTQLTDSKVTPERLRDAAKSYALVTGKAKALGVAITDAMDEPAIMKTVVDAKMGDAAKDWSAEQIAASFAVLTKDVKVGDAAPTIPNLGGVPVNIGDASTRAASAYDKMVADLRGETAKA